VRSGDLDGALQCRGEYTREGIHVQIQLIHFAAQQTPTEHCKATIVQLKKNVLFIIGDWNAKVGSQETPGVTGKFGLGIRNEAGQRLIQFCQENTLVIANTLFQQHKRRLYTWTSPDGQH